MIATPEPSLTPSQKAGVLIEALPWLGEFAGALFVVKYGGNAMVDDELKLAFAQDIAFLRYVGLRRHRGALIARSFSSSGRKLWR